MIKYISKILKDNYPLYNRYSEDVDQGFKQPCFFIRKINGSGKRLMGRKFELNSLYSVQFFPDEENEKAKCIEIEDSFYSLFETVNGIHSSNMDSVILDNVLTFTFSLDYTVNIKQEDVENMEIINIKY